MVHWLLLHSSQDFWSCSDFSVFYTVLQSAVHPGLFTLWIIWYILIPISFESHSSTEHVPVLQLHFWLPFEMFSTCVQVIFSCSSSQGQIHCSSVHVCVLGAAFPYLVPLSGSLCLLASTKGQLHGGHWEDFDVERGEGLLCSTSVSYH